MKRKYSVKMPKSGHLGRWRRQLLRVGVALGELNRQDARCDGLAVGPSRNVRMKVGFLA